MRGTGILLGVGSALVALSLTGCQSPSPQVVEQKPIVVSATPDRLALQLSEARLEQQRLERELTKLHDDLYRTALAIKQIKDRMEEVTAYAVTNAERMALIDAQIRDTRRRIGEQSGVEANTLRASLENEQRNQERLRGVLAEREREVRDLRAAMRAQQDALGDGAGTRPPAASAPSAPLAPDAKSATSASAVTIVRTNAPAVKTPTAPPVAAASTVSVFRIIAEGQRSLKSGNLERAQKMFEEARRRQPDSTSALLGLATVSYQVDDLPAARRRVEEVLAADDKNAQAYGLRGLISWREGFAKEGMRDCARAVELDPTDPLLHKFYGITLNARGQTSSAIREMRRAIELDPADAEAKLNLAILLASGPRPSLNEARKLYGEALAAGAARDAALDRLFDSAQ